MEIAIIILVCLEVLLIVILFLVFANGRKIRKEIKQLENSVDTSRIDIYKSENLEKLPEPVQRYFRHILKDGQIYINIAKIRQSGSIRLKETQKWMQLKSVQYFNAQSPAFIWVANAKSSPFFWISAIDKYFNSRASMIIRLFSLFTITKSTGKEMDKSSLVRYISEMPWFPTSFLPSNNLSWEPLNEESAIAVIKNGKDKARVTFYFDIGGELTSATSKERFRFSDGKYYKEINDIRVPTIIEAEWNLQSGDFKYFKATLEKIEYN